jgi:hypothetical protein
VKLSKRVKLNCRIGYLTCPLPVKPKLGKKHLPGWQACEIVPPLKLLRQPKLRPGLKKTWTGCLTYPLLVKPKLGKGRLAR